MTIPFRTHDSEPVAEPVEPVSLQEALMKEGYELPDGCGNVMLRMLPPDVYVLSYEIVVRSEDLAKIGRALARAAEGRRD